LLACACLLFLGSCASLSVEPVIKIGLVAPFEGRYRYVGYDVIYAVRLALREANAAGGVGGYRVELAAYDDQADPVLAVEQARKLAVDPDVVATIGHFLEETSMASLSAYGQAGIPLVSPAVLAPSLTGAVGEAYRVGPPAGVLGSALLDFVKRSGQNEAALVTGGGPVGEALQRDAQAYRLHVAPVVSSQEAGWLETVTASGVALAFCDTDPVTAGEVISALRVAGWQGVFLGGPELMAADYRGVAGDSAEGTVFVTAWPLPGDVVDGVDFSERYRGVSNGVPPGPSALPAYEATWILLEALERDIVFHEEPTREGMAEALLATERDGLLGPIAFGSGRQWGEAPLYWYRINAEGVPVLAR
jgi:branched-chain amino acid transport system substrate-binding protein